MTNDKKIEWLLSRWSNNPGLTLLKDSQTGRHL